MREKREKWMVSMWFVVSVFFFKNSFKKPVAATPTSIAVPKKNKRDEVLCEKDGMFKMKKHNKKTI